MAAAVPPDAADAARIVVKQEMGLDGDGDFEDLGTEVASEVPQPARRPGAKSKAAAKPAGKVKSGKCKGKRQVTRLQHEGDEVLRSLATSSSESYFKSAFELLEMRCVAGKLIKNNDDDLLKKYVHASSEMRDIPVEVLDLGVRVPGVAAVPRKGKPPCALCLDIRTLEVLEHVAAGYGGAASAAEIKNTTLKISVSRRAVGESKRTKAMRLKELEKSEAAKKRKPGVAAAPTKKGGAVAVMDIVAEKAAPIYTFPFDQTATRAPEWMARIERGEISYVINAEVMQPVALVKVRADVQQVCHTSWRPSVKLIAMFIGFASMVLVNGDPIPFEEKSADGEDVMENVKFWLLFAALMMMAGRQAMKDVQYLIGKVRLTAVPAVPSRFRQKSGASSEVTQTELKVKSVGVATETGGGGVCDDSRNLLGPIYIAKAGERYHLSQSCSGLRGADQHGVQVKTCCLICAKTKRDHTNCEPPSGW